MLPHQREFATAGTHFTFSGPIHGENGDQDGSDGIEFGTWTERIKGNYDCFAKSTDLRFGGDRRRRIVGDYKNYGSPDGDEFKRAAKEEDEDSSPPLWNKAETYPLRKSRAQEIAGYRQEMMDMVRNMPETAYELSLRDLVELPRMAKPGQVTLDKGRELLNDKLRKEKEKKTKNGKKRLSRSESMENGGGFLLKMFFPVSLGGKRSSTSASGTYSKVSPKPMFADGERGGLEKSSDGEWWKKNEYGEMRCSHSTSSSSSSTSRKLSGCFPFFHAHRNNARRKHC